MSNVANSGQSASDPAPTATGHHLVYVRQTLEVGSWTLGQRAVLLTLATWAGEGPIDKTAGEIGKVAGMSAGGVRKALKQLENRGVIKCQSNRNRAVYWFPTHVDPDLWITPQVAPGGASSAGQLAPGGAQLAPGGAGTRAGGREQTGRYTDTDISDCARVREPAASSPVAVPDPDFRFGDIGPQVMPGGVASWRDLISDDSVPISEVIDAIRNRPVGAT